VQDTAVNKKNRGKATNSDLINVESADSYSPLKEQKINDRAWAEFFSYYRYYVDEFAMDILDVPLYPFQRVILRSMARSQNSMFIACRGIGKSWLSALFMICMAILYPNIKCGIASGNSQQARNVIIQKIKGELVQNENIKREIIFPINTGSMECVVTFKNGSEIRAITVDQNRKGEGARSWRFQILIVDEARLVKDSIIEEILIPMTKTKRQSALKYGQSEKGKMIYISSAYLKSSGLYSRFRHHYEQMVMNHGNDYYVCALPYQVGVQAGIFDEDDITKELDKPSMSLDRYSYEYLGLFVGSSNESYYPYDIIMPCRVGAMGELEQPKKSISEYIITHDVALSDAKYSDNSCTHVIKLRQRANGSYSKRVVYTKVCNGMTLPEQRNLLRELLHIRFPNTIKLVLDTQGSGEALPSLFYETWEYLNPTTGDVIEFPPIVRDDDENGAKLKDAMPIIRAITATNEYNNKFYPYMKSCLQDKSLELLVPSEEAAQDYGEDKMIDEEFALHIEHDALTSELANIKQTVTEHNNTVYDRIIRTKKRDRATSLLYGLSVIYEYEILNKEKLYGDTSIKYRYTPLYN